MNRKAALLFSVIFCALIAKAQETPSDTTWDSDPLDVLESKEQPAQTEPPAPEFKEIPEPGKEATAEESMVEEEVAEGKTAEGTTAEEKTVEEKTVEEKTAVEATPPPEIQPTGPETEKAADVPPPEEAFPQDVPAKTPTAITEEVVPPPAVDPIRSPAALTPHNEPDYDKESEFHRIYKTYNEQPTSGEAWEKATNSVKDSRVYQVQKGDTLSGISQTFFGDPFYWPKVWALNHGKILNPHEIVPGLNVQFYPGSMEDAPLLELAQKQKEGDVDTVGDQKAVSPKQAEIAIPEITKKRTPLLKSIPGSLPPYKMGLDTKEGLELEIQGFRPKIAQGLEYLNYYVSDTALEGLGVISGTELNMKTAGDFQYVYVRFDKAPEGKEFVVQKNAGPVFDPLQKGRKGNMVEVQGELQILEPVNETKNIYRAIVKKTIQPLEVGAILTPGKMPMFNPSVGELSNDAGAKIMGGQFDRNRKMFGSNSLVFLDAGLAQGLQEGQTLPIFADLRMRNKKLEAVTNDRMIGVLKVVRVTNNFATAYIAKSTDDILLGDYVGKNVLHAFREEQPADEVQKQPVNEEAEFEDQEPTADEQQTESVEEDFSKDFEEDESEFPQPEAGTDDSDLEL